LGRSKENGSNENSINIEHHGEIMTTASEMNK
jgi:hypothetical protein